MPSPLTPPPPPPAPEPVASGADWFEEESVPEPTQGVEEAFAPTLELEETIAPQTPYETGAAWVTEAGTATDTTFSAEPGYIETVSDDEPMSEDLETLADRRGGSLAAKFGSTSAMADADDSLEDEPGFWGRLFKRKSKDRESEEFRRYPAPDLPTSRAKPLPNLSPEPKPITASKLTPPEPLVKSPAPLHREIVRPVSTPHPPSSRKDGPVVVERTVQVPIALSPEETRRGAILKLTLEVVIEGSHSGRDQAA